MEILPFNVVTCTAPVSKPFKISPGLNENTLNEVIGRNLFLKEKMAKDFFLFFFFLVTNLSIQLFNIPEKLLYSMNVKREENGGV